MEIIVNGTKTNYQTFGEGKPFLILHGWGSASERWQKVAELLAEKEFKVIVPDLPGFGKSEQLTSAWTANDYTNWVESFIKEMHLGEFYLMGHSFGGALSCKYAIKHPQDVKKLFLVSAASVRKKTAQKTGFKIIAKLAKPLSKLPFYGLFRKAFYKFIVRKSDYVHIDGALKETFVNVISDDLSQFTGFIRVPTIIIWGDKDTYTPISDAYFLNEKIKNSKLIVLKGFGHIVNRDCPEILAEKVIENI